jgi:hypothetical protein
MRTKDYTDNPALVNHRQSLRDPDVIYEYATIRSVRAIDHDAGPFRARMILYYEPL